MELFFVSKNADKRIEVSEIMLQGGYKIQPIDVEIKEIQSPDILEIVDDKLLKAFQKIQRPLIVEHTGLIIHDFGDLPGGLTQIFGDSLGEIKFSEYFTKLGAVNATAETIIGFCDGKIKTTFSGTVNGKIVFPPRGVSSFQWDNVFQPKNNTKTYGQMSTAEKSQNSMRRIALEKLIDYLRKRGL